jgi:thiol-disulfide isomerase/thioredoxin
MAIGKVLNLMEGTESFKYYLVHFLNEYAKSKIVGMDAVYVYLVEKYYATGKAHWVDRTDLDKMIDNATTLKPLLIGKIAPNITVQRKDGSKTSLHDVQSEFTVLYFWRYDCGQCKKSTPKLKEFYEKYKDKGVQIFAVCVKYANEVPECWDYIEENGISDWIHTVDPYLSSKFSSLYDIKSTPQVYVLNDKKEILSKKISAGQIGEVIDQIIDSREK